MSLTGLSNGGQPVLNSSPRLIGTEFFIDYNSGGTGEQNISQQAFLSTAVPSKVTVFFISL